MRIAQFVHRYPPALGGAEAYIGRLSHWLRSRGDTVDLWTTTAIDLEEFWTKKGPATNLTGSVRRYQPLTFPGRRYLLKALSMILPPKLRSFALPCNPVCLAMWLDAGRYDGPLDAVHATAFPYAWPILCARRLARRRGVPFLLTPFLHLSDELTRKQYLQPALLWLLKDADVVFAQTEFEQRAMINVGVKPERIVLQGLGVDPSEVTGGCGERFREKFGIPREKIIVGHLANLSIEKGSVDLFDVCRDLDCTVVLAGPSMPNFRKQIERHPACNTVITGPLTDSDRRDFYAAIDVFALPSRSDSFGLVLLEAWANAKPVMAYNLGGPGELIRHREDGLLADNPAELKTNLKEIIEDRSLRDRLGQTGRERIAGEFDWESKLATFRNAVPELRSMQMAYAI